MQVEGAAKAEEEWLVTKKVSMNEVRSELEEWRGAAKKEYAALVEESKAVKPIRKRDIDQIQGTVEVLPAKAVCTRKSPDGLRKVRGVVWQLFGQKDAERLYAGGADGLQIRMVLRTAGQRGWSLQEGTGHCPKRRDVDRRQGGLWTDYQPPTLECSPGHRDPTDGMSR